MSTHVCWISGNIHERKAFLNKLLKQFEGCDVQRLDGDVSYAYFEQQIMSSSCFAEKRLVIVDDLPQPSGTKQTMMSNMKKMLESVPDDCLVVFYGIPKKDEKALSDHVAKIGKVYDFPTTLDRNESTAFVIKQFQEHGKTIDPTDAKLVVESCGYDESLKGIGIDQIRIICHKISTFVGRRKTVSKDDVLINALGTEEFIQWRIFDAMDSKDFAECQRTFQKFLETERDWQSAVQKLYNMSIPRWRLLFFLREGLAQKVSKADLTKDALTLQKTVKNEKDDTEERVAAYTEFAVNAALNGAFGRKATVDLYSRKEIVRTLDCLQDGLSEVRLRGNDPSVLLMADVLFLSVCSQLDDSVLSQLRKIDD